MIRSILRKLKINFIDLFSGCGGFSDGFLKSGKYKAVAHVDWEIEPIKVLRKRLIDPHAIKVSQSQHDNIRYLGDIRSINYKKLGKIDLLVGGSPCQDLSHAQAGEGIKG